MKKYNYILIMVMAFAMTLTSCSQKEDIAIDDNGTRTAQVEFSLSKAQLMKSGSLVSDNGAVDEIIYCDESLADAGKVTLTYDVIFGEGSTYNLTGVTEEFDYNNTTSAGPSDGISGLIQFDFPSGENAPTTATLTITEAYIEGYDDPSTIEKETGQTFLAPKEGSPFADYVDNPVGKEWTIELYKKTYVKAEVLCFEKQAVALFGYTWFDFEILTGEEVCVFFNCLGTTRETYHQMYATGIVAYMYEDEGKATEYWAGNNYDEIADANASVAPICIPMPGNYATKGVKLELSPLGSDVKQVITITPEQIAEFLNTNNTTRQENMDLAAGDSGYKLDLDIAGGDRYLHYTMDECQKPDAYYANITTSNGEFNTHIYGVTVDYNDLDSAPFLSHFYTLNDFRGHLAISPDETELIVGETNDPGKLAIVTFYPKERTDYTVEGRTYPGMFETATPAEQEANKYKFVQYVYIDDQLYGGCDRHSCLVPINIDKEAGTFSYGPDLIEMGFVVPGGQGDIQGGDLLAAMDTDGNAIYEGHNLYSFLSTRDAYVEFYKDNDGYKETEYANVSGLTSFVTGVAMLNGTDGDRNWAITSHKDGSNNAPATFRIWHNGVYSSTLLDPVFLLSGKDEQTNTDEMVSPYGGDMASSWNNDVSEAMIKSIFGEGSSQP